MQATKSRTRKEEHKLSIENMIPLCLLQPNDPSKNDTAIAPKWVIQNALIVKHSTHQ